MLVYYRLIRAAVNLTKNKTKKRENKDMHFVMLEKIGRARIEKISLASLKEYLNTAEREKWMC